MTGKVWLETEAGYEEALTLTAAARKYRVGFRTVQSAAHRGQLATYPLGRARLTTDAAMQRWLAQRRRRGRPAGRHRPP